MPRFPRYLKLLPTSLIGIICLLSFTAFYQTALAGWFGKQKEPEPDSKIESFQPPAVDALEVHCDPIRTEAVALSQKPLWRRWLYMPKHTILVKRHRRCIQNVMEQEALYLKHVNIEQAPQLPKLQADDSNSTKDTPAPEGNNHDN